jgi:hypothetical protein
MSEFKPKDNSSATFVNKRKQTETHADYTGKALINGVEYWHNMWTKKTKDGSPYYSHSFRKVEEKQEAPFNDDIPF